MTKRSRTSPANRFISLAFFSRSMAWSRRACGVGLPILTSSLISEGSRESRCRSGLTSLRTWLVNAGVTLDLGNLLDTLKKRNLAVGSRNLQSPICPLSNPRSTRSIATSSLTEQIIRPFSSSLTRKRFHSLSLYASDGIVCRIVHEKTLGPSKRVRRREPLVG